MYLRPRRFAAAFASLSLLPLLAGCAATATRGPSGSPLPDFVAGNWQFSAKTPAAVAFPSFSGSLTGSASAISGILHSQAATACIPPSTPFEVSGAADETGKVTLSGPVGKGTLTITGTLAADGKSLEAAAYNVAGGSCALARPADAKAVNFAPVNGTYTGSFTSPGNPGLAVTATLQQSSLSDTDGNYTLNGQADFGATPCFSSPVQVSDTQVTGGSFNMTYDDTANTGSKAVVTGTFSDDASTLTVSWVLSGPCGPASGSGVLTN